MRKGTIKAFVLLIVFVASVIVFGNMTNYTNVDLTTEMEDATLPVISLYRNGQAINELHGYTSEMNAAYMRDTITPIGEDRLLPITIQTYQTVVDTISYEIRSLDAQRLIANAEVTSYQERRGRITTELMIQNLLERDVEYLLIIRLDSAGKSICYYTRIIRPVDCYVEECVEFALDFNNKTFSDEMVGSLATYMERTTGDNTTLQFVSLHSSLKQVGWANFECERLTTPVPSIKEITNTYTVIVLDYVVTSIGENGESEYYNVEEYYRVRYTSSRIYLLNFERQMEQIFRGESASIYDRFIQLGIRSGDVEYRANEAGNNVAFVQEGELWEYDINDNTLAKVFSFRGYEGIDERENYGEHEIKIVTIDEAGDLDYIVYGYMNRGIHEGEVGIAVYHYNSLANTNEEAVFIPSNKSYEVMKSELGQLMYVNEGRELFLMVNGSVYGIDLDTLNTRQMISGLTDNAFAVSESNRYIAWTGEADGFGGSSSIHVMNLSSQKTFDITAARGQSIRPLGFMEEDFIYGIAHQADIFEDVAGTVTYPMYQIRIVEVTSEQPEIVKTYEKDGYFVEGIEIIDYTMYLNRIRYNGAVYVEADQDMIMNREGEGGSPVSITSRNAGEKETQLQISLTGTVSERTPRLLTPQETILEQDCTVVLQNDNAAEHYYVYMKGDVLLATDQVTDAIILANENMGVVIGDDMEYVWKRSRNATQPALSDIMVGAGDEEAGSIAKAIGAMLEKEDINISVGALIAGGETPKSILNNTMRDMRVLDLTGCGVDEILYYISCGSPVFAMTGSSDAVLIIGYDSNNVIIYDPALEIQYRKTITDAEELFQDAGNIFFTYLK